MYRRIPPIFFAGCTGGDMSSIVKDLDRVLKKNIKDFTKRDLMSIWWVLKTVGGKK